MKRKDFIKQCSALCLGSAGISLVFQSCSSNYYAQYVLHANKIAIPKSEFILQKGEKQTIRSFVLVKDETLEFPICLYRFQENEFVALYTKCSHQGCEVQPHEEYLVCPCHGSEYSNTGKVLQPPAEQDLQQFKVTHDEENIFIQL